MLRSAILPTIFALALHGAVVALLLHNWEQPLPDRVRVEPLYIQASVVNLPKPNVKPPPPKQKPPAQVAKKQQEGKPKKVKPAQAAMTEPAQAAEPDQPSDPERTAIEVVTPQPDENDATQALLEADLMRAINAEQGARLAVTDDERAMAYIGQIQRDVIQNWSRPPSARNGMQAILKVFLVPTGEVVEVQIAESSGNAAFDRSAMVAVEKVHRFSVPSESAMFERSFREFTLLFRPEDLRL